MWHFNPPLASHFGGIFKIMVKAMKRAMKAIIGQADLDEEEFRMAVSKMSCWNNSRPIQVVSTKFSRGGGIWTNIFKKCKPNLNQEEKNFRITCLTFAKMNY